MNIVDLYIEIEQNKENYIQNLNAMKIIHLKFMRV